MPVHKLEILKSKYCKVVRTVQDVTSYMGTVPFLFCCVIWNRNRQTFSSQGIHFTYFAQNQISISSKFTAVKLPSIKLPPKFLAVSTCLATHLRDISGADNLVSSGN